MSIIIIQGRESTGYVLHIRAGTHTLHLQVYEHILPFFPTERHYNRIELHVRAILTEGQRVFENTNTYYYIPYNIGIGIYVGTSAEEGSVCKPVSWDFATNNFPCEDQWQNSIIKCNRFDHPRRISKKNFYHPI